MTLSTSEYKKLYQEYDRMVRSKGFKTGSGKMYQACLHNFLSWMEKKSIVQIVDIDSKTVKEYLDYLITRPNKRRGGTLSVSTINHNLFSLRLFFNHLLDTGYAKEVVFIPNNLARDSRSHPTLSEKEIKLLYKFSETKLERAILAAGYGCGLRRSELSELNVTDLSFSSGLLVVTKGKGNKVRDVIMSQAVIRDLKDYYCTDRLEHIRNNKADCDAFFLNAKAQRLSGDFLYKTLKALILKTGNSALIEKKPTLHSLRHSIATHLVDRGMDMLSIRNFLGHVEVDTTSIYMARRKRKNKYLI